MWRGGDACAVAVGSSATLPRVTSTRAPSQPAGDPAGKVPAASTSSWLTDALEVVEQRRSLVVATAAAVSLLGLLAAFLLPQVIPPTPLAGAAVGVAAALLAVAVALGVDALDLTVRGARHVRAAGGRYLGTLAGDPGPGAADPLAAELEVRLWEQGHLRVGFAPVASDLPAVARWADATAVALAERDHRVLLVDLTREDPWRDGVADIVRDGRPLAHAVTFDAELLLARIAAGHSTRAALAAFPKLAARLPRDVDVVLVVLPSMTQPGVLPATEGADRVLLLAELGRTPRVDILAGLDALGDSSADAEVVLLAPEPVAGEETGPAAVGRPVARPQDALDAPQGAVEDPHVAPAGARAPVEDPHGSADLAFADEVRGPADDAHGPAEDAGEPGQDPHGASGQAWDGAEDADTEAIRLDLPSESAHERR